MEKITIHSNITQIEEAITSILDSVNKFDVAEETFFDIKLMLSEILVNAMTHGNLDDPGKKIFVFYKIENRKLTLTVEDEGEGFDYNNVADPSLPDNLTKSSGRGIFLVKNLSDLVSFNLRGNSITFEKTLIGKVDM